MKVVADLHLHSKYSRAIKISRRFNERIVVDFKDKLDNLDKIVFFWYS